ncbi:hypothetical protein ELQ35_03630 [Peribacillus cavernae]|uniref:SbsC C-terminal domain-containing protein n=1 Tax=Peribacillus cavernae TaxID=1674310 RepID=A0A433HT02_9BACI|nr:hypothetical protein [Peribacillus cavernae]MDQ0218451.1 hypothetical protein [Peribacillus cavernae]RUQ31450.1 hypothetical protein ELQ35_03630 [Peribacillus cavernae]
MRINKKKMFAAMSAATLVSSGFVSIAPQPASAAVSTSSAKSLVSKAESAAYRLHTLYTTVGRYHVITTEFTAAKSQYTSALKAVNSLPSSSTKTDLLKRLQKVKGYLDRATNFNNALYAASNVYKHIGYLEEILKRDTLNRNQLRTELTKLKSLTEVMRNAINKLYSSKVQYDLENKYLSVYFFSDELHRILDDTLYPLVEDVTETKYNVMNIILFDVSGLNTAVAMNKNNYKIDGKVIPTNSVIKVLQSGKHQSTVQITLPKETILETKPYSIAVSSLKDKYGFVMNETRTNEVNLTDNVSPVLKEVKINESQPNQLIFSYSEPLATPIKQSDIKMTVYGTTIPTSKIRVTPELNESGQATGRDLVSLDSTIHQQADIWDQYYIEMDRVDGFGDRDLLLGFSDSFAQLNEFTVGTNATTVSVDKSPNRNLLKANTTITINEQ